MPRNNVTGSGDKETGAGRSNHQLCGRGTLVVQVIEETFEDAGEQDANGLYDYYYSGVIYRLVFPDREFHARRYDDTPGEAHFLAFSTSSGERRLFEAIPYDDQEFAESAAYLRDAIGVDAVRILLPSGYVPLDFAQFPGELRAKGDMTESFHCFQCRAAIPEGLFSGPCVVAPFGEFKGHQVGPSQSQAYDRFRQGERLTSKTGNSIRQFG